MSQFKYLAENFSQTGEDTEEERRWATLLVRYVVGGSAHLDEGGMSNEEIKGLVDDLLTVANQQARSGCDRCECGCKYWENDRCIDCRTAYDPDKFKEEAS